MKYIFCIFCLAILEVRVVLAEDYAHKQFIKEVAQYSQVSQGTVSRVTHSVFRVIRKRMIQDQSTRIPYFGKFYTGERTYKNLIDREGFKLGPRKVLTPKFKASYELKEALKEHSINEVLFENNDE